MKIKDSRKKGKKGATNVDIKRIRNLPLKKKNRSSAESFYGRNEELNMRFDQTKKRRAANWDNDN